MTTASELLWLSMIKRRFSIVMINELRIDYQAQKEHSNEECKKSGIATNPNHLRVKNKWVCMPYTILGKDDE